MGKASECVQPTQVVVGAFLAGGTKATPLFQRDADPNLLLRVTEEKAADV